MFRLRSHHAPPASGHRRITPLFKPSNRHDPVPESSWTIDIDGAHLAQPAVWVDFKGTVTPPKMNAAHAAQRARRNAETLEAAILILSQSATGRDLLTAMKDNGYKIIFDDARTSAVGAGGLCDSDDKALILHATDDPHYLALLIGHEAVHARQNMNQDLFPTSEHRPAEAIKLSFAIEADAYAQQVQIALELYHGDRSGPDNQAIFAEPLQEMRRRFPDLCRAAERAMIADGALDDGRVVAAAFQAFYHNLALRNFYEDSHMDWAEPCAEEMAKPRRRHLKDVFNKAADNNWIKQGLTHRGRAYLADHAKSLDFAHPLYSGVSEKTAARIDAFYKTHPGIARGPAPQIHGLSLEAGDKQVTGLLQGHHFVLQRRKNTHKIK